MSKLTTYRILAFLIDELIISAIFLVINYDNLLEYMQTIDIQDTGSLQHILIYIQNVMIQIILIEFIYQTIFVYLYGASVGKLILKIKITSTVKDKPNLLTAINRASLRTIGKYFLFQINFIWAIGDKEKLTLHDKLAKTKISWSE